jgi:hypothetical protein
MEVLVIIILLFMVLHYREKAQLFEYKYNQLKRKINE